MQVIPTSSRPRDAIRNAETRYALEWSCIRAGKEAAWKQRVQEELAQLKTISTEGRLRYEAALLAREGAGVAFRPDQRARK